MSPRLPITRLEAMATIDEISIFLLLLAVVKKTLRYSNVFFYNRLYQPSVFRNLFLKSGAKLQFHKAGVVKGIMAIGFDGFKAQGKIKPLEIHNHRAILPIPG